MGPGKFDGRLDAQSGPDQVDGRVHTLGSEPLIALGSCGCQLLEHEPAVAKVGVLGGGELWHLDPRTGRPR